jgi:hypothetical protein
LGSQGSPEAVGLPAYPSPQAEVRIETDRLDSQMLGHPLRTDLISEAYAPSKEVRMVKRVLRLSGRYWCA